MSKDRDMLANTLYIYSKRGILQILHENCP
jgi:hypothetical protein